MTAHSYGNHDRMRRHHDNLRTARVRGHYLAQFLVVQVCQLIIQDYGFGAEYWNSPTDQCRGA